MTAFVVSIDGPDFCGKSTISALLLAELRKRDLAQHIKKTALPSVLVTGMFTGILRNSRDSVDPKVFALTYAADHLHHDTWVRSLKESDEDYLIIQERSLLSTYVYQGLMGGLDLSWVREINKFDTNIPDLSIILKLPLEELVARKGTDNRSFDVYETTEKLKKQTQLYYELPKELESEFNVRVLDANKDPEEVARNIADLVEVSLKENVA